MPVKAIYFLSGIEKEAVRVTAAAVGPATESFFDAGDFHQIEPMLFGVQWYHIPYYGPNRTWGTPYEVAAYNHRGMFWPVYWQLLWMHRWNHPLQYIDA